MLQLSLRTDHPAGLTTDAGGRRTMVHVVHTGVLVSDDRQVESGPPYPPTSILDGGGMGGRSTIDYMIARTAHLRPDASIGRGAARPSRPVPVLFACAHLTARTY